MRRSRFALPYLVLAVLFAANSATAAMQHRMSSDALEPLGRKTALGQKLRIARVPVGDGEVKDLELERFEVWRSDAVIAVYGPDEQLLEKLPAPESRYFRGTVAGDPDSLVFISKAGERVEGFVFRGERRFSLGSQVRIGTDGRRGIDLTVQEVEEIDEIPLDGKGFSCDLEGKSLRPGSRPRLSTVIDGLNADAKAQAALSSATATWVLNLAIDTDYELYTNSGGSSGNVTTFIGNLIAAASTIYKRDLSTDLFVSFLGIQTAVGDPFVVTPGASGTWNGVTKTLSSFHALLELADRWHNSPPAAAAGQPRSSTILISGKPQLAGIAWVGTICTGDFLCQNGNCGNADANGHYGGAYAFCGGIDPPGDLSVPNPDGNVNYVAPATNYWPLLQTTHELGHNVGSGHTHCIPLGAPDAATYGRSFVDNCYNGEAGSGCFGGTNTVPTEKGTIMSYCHLSMGGTATRFTFGKTAEASYVVPAAMKADVQAVTPALSVITAPSSVAPSVGTAASVTNVPGVTYSWSITNGIINSGGTTNAVNFSGTTNPVTLRVKATNAAGCSVTDYKMIEVTAASCDYELNKSFNNFTAAGGSDTVNVTATDAGCAWTATEAQTWITLTTTVPVNGNGSVSYSVAANTGAERSATITIAGDSFTVNQSGCGSTAINNNPQTFLKNGGNGSIPVTTACAWSALTSVPSWISLTNSAGVGSGNVTFTVAAYTGNTFRQGTITVGAQSVTITQYGNMLRGDFNADAKPDILWRNQSTGQNRLWTMNGTVRNATVALETVAPPWVLAGTGDFNNDGMNDLVWRNGTTGQNSVWFMNLTSRTSFTTLPSATGDDWKIVSINDWDGDGDPDMIWRNVTTGQNSVWIMNGVVRLSVTLLPTAAPEWLCAGSGDVTGDGRPDLFWRNKNSGANSIWRMNGAAIAGVSLLTTVPDQNWQPGAIVNANGDGAVDVYWRFGAGAGTNSLWTLSLPNGAFVTSAVTVSEADANWKMIGPR